MSDAARRMGSFMSEGIQLSRHEGMADSFSVAFSFDYQR